MISVLLVIEMTRGHLYQKGLYMRTFTLAQDLHDFAYEKGVPFTRLTNLSDMNSRQILGLSVQGAWVLGINTELRLRNGSDEWTRSNREYISLDSFRIENNALVEKQNARISGYYCYQLSHDPMQIICLENLSHVPLSTQLMDLTGDSFSTLAFHDEHNPSTLSAGNVIIHKKTKQRFFVPAAPIERIE